MITTREFADKYSLNVSTVRNWTPNLEGVFLGRFKYFKEAELKSIYKERLASKSLAAENRRSWTASRRQITERILAALKSGCKKPFDVSKNTGLHLDIVVIEMQRLEKKKQIIFTRAGDYEALV